MGVNQTVQPHIIGWNSKYEYIYICVLVNRFLQINTPN